MKRITNAMREMKLSIEKKEKENRIVKFSKKREMKRKNENCEDSQNKEIGLNIEKKWVVIFYILHETYRVNVLFNIKVIIKFNWMISTSTHWDIKENIRKLEFIHVHDKDEDFLEKSYTGLYEVDQWSTTICCKSQW